MRRRRRKTKSGSQSGDLALLRAAALRPALARAICGPKGVLAVGDLSPMARMARRSRFASGFAKTLASGDYRQRVLPRIVSRPAKVRPLNGGWPAVRTLVNGRTRYRAAAYRLRTTRTAGLHAARRSVRNVSSRTRSNGCTTSRSQREEALVLLTRRRCRRYGRTRPCVCESRRSRNCGSCLQAARHSNPRLMIVAHSRTAGSAENEH